MSAIPHSREAVVRTRPYPRARVISRRKGGDAAGIARFVAWTFAAMVVMHLAAGFFGQIMIEEARRAAIRAEGRAALANLEATEIRRQLDQLYSAGKVSQWARMNGFVSSYGGD